MLIIVEGPNGAGKTTLVEGLQKYVQNNLPASTLSVRRKGPPTAHPLLEYVEPLVGYRPTHGEHIICDRWHWGEAVYPELFGRHTAMDTGVWRYVEMFLRSRGAVVVYPHVSVNTLADRILHRGDDLIEVGQIPHEWAAFNAVRFRSTLPVRTVTDYAHYKHVSLDEVIQLAQQHEVGAGALNTLVTYVGPPRPGFLLVGDDRSRKDLALMPAFGPFAPTSGHFLMNALSGPRLASLGIMNANDVDDVLLSWRILGQPPVVALGRRAARRLDVEGVPHSTVPHPQFIRRFHHRRSHEYGAIIDSAMATRRDLSRWRP